MRVSVERSLKKLQTDYIDLLYIHWWDFISSVEEVMHGLNNLVNSGKVLYLGVSDTPAWVVVKANDYARVHGLRPFSVYQGKWNAGFRDLEREIIPMCRDQGMAIAPWAPLGQGKFKSSEARSSDSEGGCGRASNMSEHDIQVSDALEKVAKRKNTTLHAVALAYVMHKTPSVFPIVGQRKVEHLKANVEALSVSLSDEDLAEIDNASSFDIGFPMNFIFRDSYTTNSTAADVSFTRVSAHIDAPPNPSPVRPRRHLSTDQDNFFLDDPTLSSTSKILDKGGFTIQYVTPGSGVKGDYVGDNFGFGSVTVQGLTMGVARQAQYVIKGIMGIGFAAGESIVSQGQRPHKNIIDMLVEQELINTRAYSLWLNDKLSNGNDACVFGVVPITDDSPILFGDTFLRSAYVVYDLDQQQIAIAPTWFNSEDTNIVEISGKTGSSSPNWKTAGSNAAKVTQTATGLQAPGGLSPATAPTGWVFSQTATPFHLPGKGGSVTGDQASSSPSKGAASSSVGIAVPGALASITVASLS
ncbi:NADP-dependent oxidoreductase domain [Aspergillus oryzae]|uniref:NADP-dependent oxidoreductase domain n=1 Tax=Aspergillus oryzae TaxID=5062 RepID=A0A1S9DXW1_ASPOZ|nr:NADP-dependent oxidoreductase domain [Aspergillus oryzae]